MQVQNHAVDRCCHTLVNARSHWLEADGTPCNLRAEKVYKIQKYQHVYFGQHQRAHVCC